ncbi:MAG: argininosuccinate lyase [Proteobacteria bacterium]|nr:argininosuccinate lyase [Pseudomonadota bacterium]
MTLAFGSMLPVAAQAEAKQDFDLVNRTGYAISEVYVSPSKTDDWQDDLLENSDNNFEDGEKRSVHFTRAGKTCKWDLKVVYDDDDSSAVWHDIDLCEVSRITLRYNRKTDTTSASFD